MNIIFEIISLIALTSIWVLGIKIVTHKGMLLEDLGEWCLNKSERHKMFEALCVCQWCMPSIHSLVGYGFAIAIGILTKLKWSLLFMYPIVVMGSSLTCGIIWLVYELLTAKKGYYENKQTLTQFDISDRKRKFYHNKLHNNGNKKGRVQ